jgi:hypothetical protein
MSVGKLIPPAAPLFGALLLAIAACAPASTGDTGSDGSAGTGGGAGSVGAAGQGAAAGIGGGAAGAGGAAGSAVTGSGGGTTGAAGVGAAGSSAAGTGGGGGAAGAGAVSGTGGRGGAAGSGGRGGGSGATGAAGTGAGGSAAAPVVSGLMVEANPNSTISCYVNWMTNVAASSEVQFGAGSYQFSTADAVPVTQHRVLVIGMKAQTRYMIKAISTTAGGSGSAEGSFMTGALPAQIVAGQVGVAEAGAYQPGWTLTNLMAGSGGFQSMYPAAAVMFDEQGVPIWYFINGTGRDSRGDVSVDLLANNHILIGPIGTEPPKEIDLGGNVIWRGPAQTATGTAASHHAGKLTNGNYVIIRDDRMNSAGITGSRLDEVTPQNQVVWTWNLTDYVQPSSGAQMDWCHANAATVDLANDIVYFACRYLGVFKIKKSDKSLLWHLGPGGDFTFSPAASAFVDEHDPEFHADGTVMIYDNGGLAMGSTAGYHSRVVEYRLDETAKRATLVWEFPGTFTVDAWYKNDWYTPYWGDADRLANGNVLINAGIRDASKPSRIFEVRASDGKVVWQMVLPANTGTYRAERIAPLVTKL